MIISIVTWNLDSWKRNKVQRQLAWNYLVKSLDPDIALLQEFVPQDMSVESHNVLYRQIGDKRRFGSAIVTKKYPINEIDFKNGYPGAVIAADVKLKENLTLTAISIYGVIDENGFATTTLHRILSDLNPILTSSKRNICMGGDYNVSTQWDEKYHKMYPSHKIVFDRIEDFGLIDCTKKEYGKHIQTIHHSQSNYPWQNDYIHLSKNLSKNIISCNIIDEPEILELSDHTPIIIKLEI